MSSKGIDVNRVKAPILVMGGVSMREVRAIARACRSEAEFSANMGHDMMLEQGWKAVAKHFDS